MEDCIQNTWRFITCNSVRLIGVAVFVSLVEARAVAQTQPSDVVRAEEAFVQARKLRDQGDWNGACEKFSESQRLDPSSGTLYNLAVCHLKQGKTATAWSEFVACERLARTQKRQHHELAARRQASALEPQLSTLTIQVAEKLTGMDIRRGDVHLELGFIGARVPVDPGDYDIVIIAPGYEPYRTRVSIGLNADAKTVQVPKLQKRIVIPDAEVPHAARKQPQQEVQAKNSEPSPVGAKVGEGTQLQSKPGWRTAALIVGGLGAGSLIAGGVFGGLAYAKNQELRAQCSGTVSSCPPPALSQALEMELERNRYLNVADWGVGIGLGLLVVGVGSYWLTSSDDGETAPQGLATSIQLVPWAGMSDAGIGIRGGF